MVTYLNMNEVMKSSGISNMSRLTSVPLAKCGIKNERIWCWSQYPAPPEVMSRKMR